MALLLDHYRRAQAQGVGMTSAPPSAGQVGLTDTERASLQAQQANAWALDPANVTAMAQAQSQPGAAQQRAQTAAATDTFKAEDKSKAAQASMGLSDRDRAAYQTFMEEDAAKQRAAQQQAASAWAQDPRMVMAYAQKLAAMQQQAQQPPPAMMAASDRRLKTRINPAADGLRRYLDSLGGRRG
jgi:hypothetical protein